MGHSPPNLIRDLLVRYRASQSVNPAITGLTHVVPGGTGATGGRRPVGRLSYIWSDCRDDLRSCMLDALK